MKIKLIKKPKRLKTNYNCITECSIFFTGGGELYHFLSLELGGGAPKFVTAKSPILYPYTLLVNTPLPQTFLFELKGAQLNLRGGGYIFSDAELF